MGVSHCNRQMWLQWLPGMHGQSSCCPFRHRHELKCSLLRTAQRLHWVK
jgi:hypothetical protein